ncbi:hypothetical protein MesoLj131b_00970 [Mesorhizobium sp. 131-2-5]|uniref:hypothetical protein n=1 Tax=Mesorhizobium sp. 131-2-5 TaxID=2744519 RepID=UPI0019261F85|nr:hypothetical protein [Mesorhizobium sp. 131-2-5]BCG98097.1 hypothetical protein MesoLj131b_00970 [Mesorhizobium sp. 131-2-5]
MSGPKVVRIVTREELIAACEGQIAVFEAMVGSWERFGERNRCVDQQDIEQTRDRVRAMRALLAGDNFEEVQKRVPAEISFLKSDMDRRMNAAADAAAAARKRAHQLMRSAETLARSLRDKGLPVPKELSNPSRHSDDAVRTAISAAFSQLAPASSDGSISDRQRMLADSLGVGEERTSLAAWLESQSADIVDDPLIDALDRKLDELRIFDPEAATTFAARLDAVAAETGTRRGLLADSLTIDLSAAQREAVYKIDIRSQLEGIRTEFASIEGQLAGNIILEVEQALAPGVTIDRLHSAFDEAKLALETIRNEQAVALRRHAMLEGLAELGYEVRQGMETAWVEHGRVVLRSSKSPDYGVELGGNPESLLQIRTVAFDDPHRVKDATRDVKAETEFCTDFEALQKLLAANGAGLSIVKALGVGATPVKTVRAIDTPSEAAFVASTHNSRRTRN